MEGPTCTERRFNVESAVVCVVCASVFVDGRAAPGTDSTGPVAGGGCDSCMLAVNGRKCGSLGVAGAIS